MPERMSMENTAWPGTTLVAPLGTLNWPTVPTRPGLPPQRFSMYRPISAPAMAASRRMSIGTVPAWPARPSSSTIKRVAPEIAVTTPTGRPSFSSTGPCSICTSMKAATLLRSCLAAGRLAASKPASRITSRMVLPLSSTLSSTLLSKVPAMARLPSSVALKRTPSSSAKPTTSSANGKRLPWRFHSATQAIGRITPRLPS
ncbi:hypothetical protein D3C72_1520630 [compost metagenome]